MTIMTLSRALNTGLRAAMESDDKVVITGQDVAALGGVFRVTDGLAKDFGDQRVFNSLLAESSMIGSAIGLAFRGYRPICEIQFDGFVYPAYNQILTQLAKIRFRTAGLLTAPVVIRMPVGGGIGAVEHHSESNESLFTHVAGLRVVYCSTSNDAHWMIRQAAASNDPVMFYEPKRRYWSKGEVADSADDPAVLPLDRARVVRPGKHATLLCWGGTVATCLEAAEIAAEDGRELEVVDLRSLQPLDLETIVGSVRRTGRAVIVHEAAVFGGFGGELVAQLTKECFFTLEAPVGRVGAYHLPYPPAKTEEHYLPDVDRVLDAVDDLFTY
jgi:2-oxoisovalerate dehydrogenase E1 component beta subunit